MRNIFLLLLVSAALLITGCQEQNVTAQKGRFIAEENLQLKHQLRKQVELLEQCRDEQVSIRERANDATSTLMTTIVADITNENAELKAQNTNLLAEIESLKSK